MKTEEYLDRWGNRYSIKCGRFLDRYYIGREHDKRSYGIVYRLYEFLDKLNVKTNC